MPQPKILTCPVCEEVLEGDIEIEKPIDCPVCSERVVPVPAPRSSLDSEKVRTTGLAGPSTSPLKSLYRGISCVYFGLYLLVASVLVLILGTGLAGASGGIGALTSVAIIGGGMMFVGTLLGFAGRIICLDAPDDLPGRNLIFLAVTLDLIVLAIAALSWVTTPPKIADYSNLMAIASNIIFLFFLKNVAKYLNDKQSENSATLVLNIGICVFVTLVMGWFFWPPFVFISLLLLLVGFLVYVGLLISLRKSLQGGI